jgi:hypothetical protein
MLSFAPLRCLIAAFAVAGVTAASAHAATQIVPHRAVYDLSLAKARSSQTASQVDGRMTFVWKDVCDGWSIEYDTAMDLVFAKQGTQSVSWRYTAWESNDSTRMRFFLERAMNGRQTLKRRGRAEKDRDGGTAVITAPERKEIPLEPGTMFPGEHSRAILDAARAGERFLYAPVFDGTGDSNGLFVGNAVILDSEQGNAPELEVPLLADVPSWRINLAFFAPDDTDGTPQSEQSVRYYANGVAGTLTLDYGDFVVRAELTELEALDRPDCG